MTAPPGKVAIVARASRGIGKAIALCLADEGFAVTVGFVSERVQPEAVVAAI